MVVAENAESIAAEILFTLLAFIVLCAIGGGTDVVETLFGGALAGSGADVVDMPAAALGAFLGVGVLSVPQWRQHKPRTSKAARRAEVERQLADALAAADAAHRAKSIFLATMSHEFRTPLNAILGFSDVIRFEVHGPVMPDKYKEYAADIHRSGEQLLAMINTVLDMALIESASLDLCETDVNVDAILSNAIATVGDVARARKVTIDAVAETLPTLHADEKSIRRIFVNLLGNAVKYNVPGGAVVVDGAVNADGELSVSVRDTGVGIAPEDVPKVAKPFTQVRPMPFVAADGAGLGLTIVDQLMFVHGGRMVIRSDPGAGTDVAVVFPKERVRLPAGGQNRQTKVTFGV